MLKLQKDLVVRGIATGPKHVLPISSATTSTILHDCVYRLTTGQRFPAIEEQPQLWCRSRVCGGSQGR